MPLDSMGKMRHNSQSAAMHSKGKDPKMSDKTDSEPMDTEGATEVHNNGDGSFKTVHGGQEEHHETIGHMHAHLSKLHGEPGGKHFHGHSDGMTHHSHSVETGGEPEHKDHEDEHGIPQHAQGVYSGGNSLGDDPQEHEQNESAIGGY